MRRPRLYWTSWEVERYEAQLKYDRVRPLGYIKGVSRTDERMPVAEFLDEGATRDDDAPLPTMVRWAPWFQSSFVTAVSAALEDARAAGVDLDKLTDAWAEDAKGRSLQQHCYQALVVFY